MVDEAYLKQIGLSPDQAGLLLDALDKERRFRSLLLQEGISSKVVDSILRVSAPENMDFGNENLLREKIRIEWESFIVK